MIDHSFPVSKSYLLRRPFNAFCIGFLIIWGGNLEAVNGNLITGDTVQTKQFSPYYIAGFNLLAALDKRLDAGLEYHFQKKLSTRIGVSSGYSDMDFLRKERTTCLMLEGMCYPFQSVPSYVAPYLIYRTGQYDQLDLLSNDINRKIDITALDAGVMIGINWNIGHISINLFAGMAHEFFMEKKIAYDPHPDFTSETILPANTTMRLGINLGFNFRMNGRSAEEEFY